MSKKSSSLPQDQKGNFYYNEEDYDDIDEDYDYCYFEEYVDDNEKTYNSPSFNQFHKNNRQQQKAQAVGKPKCFAKPVVLSPQFSELSSPLSCMGGTHDADGINTQYEDYEVLHAALTEAKKILPPTVLPKKIVDLLRLNNYAVNQTVETYLQNKKHGGKVLKLQTEAKKNGISDNNNSRIMLSTTPITTNELYISSFMSDTSTTRSSSLLSMRVSCDSINSTSSPLRKDHFSPSAPVLDGEGKQSLTLVIAGHVDSGKSTTLGNMLFLLGYFKLSDIIKNEKAATNTKMKSFKYAWLLDQSEEERRRGITIDNAFQFFETKTKSISVFDAPGHKEFIMNMVCSATQADAALLIVSSHKGEFESGLHHGTKDHLMILKVLGASSLLVAINKMDSVDYSEERYNEIIEQLKPMIHEIGFTDNDTKAYVPISGLEGVNLVDGDKGNMMPWYKGKCLVDAIDSLTVRNRFNKCPLRIVVQDVQKNFIYGLIGSGEMKLRDTIIFMPSKREVVVRSLKVQNDKKVTLAHAGSIVTLVSSSNLADICAGDVGCDRKNIIVCSKEFEAEVDMFGPDHLATAVLPGSQFVIGIQTTTVEVIVEALVSKISTDGTVSKGMVKTIPPNGRGVVRFKAERVLPLEKAASMHTLGTFVLKQNGEVVGGGIVTKIFPES